MVVRVVTMKTIIMIVRTYVNNNNNHNINTDNTNDSDKEHDSNDTIDDSNTNCIAYTYSTAHVE